MRNTRIRLMKNEKELTTKQLAKMVNIADTTLRSYENGSVSIESMSLATAIKLCVALDCDIADFFTESKYNKLKTIKNIRD